MKPPRMFKAQFAEYKKAGFNVKDAQPSKGCHYKVWFEEFPEPQFLTYHTGDPRAMKNNIARFRGLAKKAKEQK